MPYPKGQRLYQAAVFWVTPAGPRPVNPSALPEFAQAATTLTSQDAGALQKLMSDAAKFVIRTIRSDVRTGAIPLTPLSPLTRAKKGHDTPLVDSGALLEALVPNPPKNAPGALGFSVTVDTTISTANLHKPNSPYGQYIDMVHLWNIVTRSGALINLSNESVRRRIFGFYQAMGLLSDKDTPLKQALRGRLGKAYIYIPPRPIFTDPYVQNLAERAWERIIKPRLENAASVAAKAMQYGPLSITSKTKWILSKWKALTQSMQAAEET